MDALLILAACGLALIVIDWIAASRRASEDPYWIRVRKRARELGSDGCTGGGALFRDCCLEHDIHERTHRTPDGHPITEYESDRRFLHCMQRRSFVGWWTPIGWSRYAAVRIWRRWRAWRAGS